MIPCTSAPRKLLMTSLKPRPYSNERIAFFYWWNLPPNYCNIAISSILRHSLLEREDIQSLRKFKKHTGPWKLMKDTKLTSPISTLYSSKQLWKKRLSYGWWRASWTSNEASSMMVISMENWSEQGLLLVQLPFRNPHSCK